MNPDHAVAAALFAIAVAIGIYGAVEFRRQCRAANRQNHLGQSRPPLPRRNTDWAAVSNAVKAARADIAADAEFFAWAEKEIAS